MLGINLQKTGVVLHLSIRALNVGHLVGTGENN